MNLNDTAPSIILPSEFTEAEDRIAGGTHHLDDKWLSSRLIAWLMLEADSKCWACMLRTDGVWHYWQKTNATPPNAHKRNYARSVVRYLNKHLHHDGAWVGAWMDDGWKRFYLLWKDRDGDIQFPIDTAGEVRWEELNKWTMEDWGNHATAAFTNWRCAMEAIGATPDQQVKLAQGQGVLS